MITLKKITGILGMFLIIMSFTSCSEDAVVEAANGSITGKVVAAGTFTPLENAKVTVSSNNTSVFTDANGDFFIERVSAGQQSVSAEKDGYLTSFEGADVPNNGSINVVFELTLSTAANRPPDQPTLVSPDDNSTDLELTVDLLWSATDPDEDVMTYKVELRNDSNNDVEMFEAITDTTYTLTGLDYGTKYFWQVSANDGVNQDVWSTVRTFRTKIDPTHRFAFVRNIGGNDIIFSGNPNTEETDELQLTDSGANSWRPRKNQNNGRIAFLRTIGAETHLFSMLPDGSDIKQITGAVPVNGYNLTEVDYCWSHNGDRLLYPSFDKLYKINKDGSGLTLVYQTPDGSLISECDWTVDESTIALKTNNINGYGISIFTIDMAGNVIDTLLSGVNGAAGGINFSVDSNLLLYCYDISGFESPDYRQLNTHIFIYNFSTMVTTDISQSKPAGFNDLDPRFSPNEAEVVFMYTSNDGLSENMVMKIDIASLSNRAVLFNNAKMPDWE